MRQGTAVVLVNRSTLEDIREALTTHAMAIDWFCDWLMLVEENCGFTSLLRYSTLEEINGTGCVPLLETPEKITKALVEFINNIRRN